MIFLLLSIVVPVVVFAFFPTLFGVLFKQRFRRDGWLLFACFLYFFSWYLPSPFIHGVDTAFTTHLVGGGVFCGLLWLYVQRQTNRQASWMLELASVYGWVSAFGVANELFELAIVELHLTRLSGADTWWDLLANTSGALLFWIFYRIALKIGVMKR